MSAICGIFYFDDRPVSEETLQAMVTALAHRGVDGSGVWRKNNVALGHLMLHITPESLKEELPHYDAKRNMAITADARIDNRKELFHKLGIPSWQENSMPDSLFILKAYERWGKNFLNHLLGEFAFALWDGLSQELIIATDSLGMCPLCYYHTSETFIFASEIKAIHAVKDVPRVVNQRKIASLAIPALRHMEPETTFFKGIRIIPGATLISVNRNRIQKEVYWRPDPAKRIYLADENLYAEAFREIFEKAVSARLRSAFPVISLYSGGLDSTAVTATAAHLMKKKGGGIKAFSAILPPEYRGSGTDERCYIDLLKNGHGIDIEYISDPWRGPFDDLESLITVGDHPFFTSRHFLYTAFAERARPFKGRVFLTGEGGESGPSFHGRGYYAELLLQGKWHTLTREIRLRAEREDRRVAGLFRAEVMHPLIPFGLTRHIKPTYDTDQIQRLMPLREDFFKNLFGKRWKHLQRQSFSFRRIWPNHRVNQLKALSNRQRGRQGGGFVGFHRVCMTSPLMDRRVLEFCLAVPGSMKVRNGYSRYLIRVAMKGIVPDPLRFRIDKNPFSPDFHDRYNRQKHLAFKIVQRARRNPVVNEIVDLDRLQHMLGFTMQSNRCNRTVDFACMHAVPLSIYLIYFLEHYAR